MGVPPFSDANANRVIKDIVGLKFHPADWLSSNLKKLLCGLLKKVPSHRLTVNQIKASPFFKDIDWALVIQKAYKPPIKPKVKNEGDTKHIDKHFLKQSVKDTAPA